MNNPVLPPFLLSFLNYNSCIDDQRGTMSPANQAAWMLKPKGDLKRFTAAYNAPSIGEIVIKVH